MQLKKSPCFEIRGGICETLLCVVKTTDLAVLKAELLQRFEATPEFFANEAVIIDVRRLEAGQHIAVNNVATLLRSVRLSPAGVAANPDQYEWAHSADLPLVQANDQRAARAAASRPPQSAEQIGSSVSEATVAIADNAPASVPTLLCERPLRSGQQIYAPGDLIVMALVSHGAEIIAGGNIHVYAPLRGRALAGVHGNHQARIFCTCMEPELISIAGIYRTAENPLSPELLGKPVQVSLAGEKLMFEVLRLN